MAPLKPRPRLKLSRLRDIGWREWDPIGLLDMVGDPKASWNDPANRAFADEYDQYLIAVASKLRQGATSQEAIAYLVNIETKHMCLAMSPSVTQRAAAVVQAIVDDAELWTEPDNSGKFPD